MAPRNNAKLQWEDLESFDALPGDVVIRRWESRETGRYKYALIECWKGRSDLLPGNEFVVIDDGRSSDQGLRSLDYWSR